MTMTHVYDTNGTEVPVWDSQGNLVWGPLEPGPVDPPVEPVNYPYPATDDPMILRMRPAVEDLVKVYEVDPSSPSAYPTITDAYNAVGSDRSALGIRGAGPQDYALIRVAPGDYNERIRPADWTATVSTTGKREDVRVWYDYGAPDSNTASPVLNPGGPGYIEGITFEALAEFEHEPAAGQAPAAIWLVNGAPGASTTLVNVLSRSNNRYLNTGAWQAGDKTTVATYRCRFEMLDGSQPVNAQTAQVWRSMVPEHHATYLHIDCEASSPEGLVVGVADLGYGAADEFIWSGGTIGQTPETVAQFFHSSFFIERNPDNPYNCVSYVTPQVTYAGEGEHYWSLPADFDSKIPTGGITPDSASWHTPHALDMVGVLTTGTADTTLDLVPNRWYLVPLPVAEARTWAGAEIEVLAGTAGTISAALWSGAVRGAIRLSSAYKQTPGSWLTMGATSNITTGKVQVHRGTYKRVRIYPGPQIWVGIKADTACTVKATAAHPDSNIAYYVDSTSFPGGAPAVQLQTGPLPVVTVKTGVV